uniref:TIR domain-containing protein n=1 Tax=Sinocyclocheilus rhinocerous TaxID=307959 RepID=A0A673IP11_9TELE
LPESIIAFVNQKTQSIKMLKNHVLCSRMSYRKIPSPLPHNTVNLDISYNAIHQIVEGDFIRLSNLIILNISHNRISEIHSNALSDLANLEELNLSNNKIKTVTTKLLNGLANLSHLRLDSNYLETTENQSFATLSNLRLVNLTNNKLKHISKLHPVLQAPHLEELYLGKNGFKVFNSSDIPSAFFGLKKLDLSMNPLTVFKMMENIFLGLEYLDLSSCFHSNISDWFILDKAFLNTVKTLNLSRNHIEENQLDYIMQSFASVTWMALDGLKGFKVDTFLQTACSSSLRSIHLEDNNLSVLTHRMFRPCALLNDLHLRNNGVSRIIGNLDCSDFLILSSNRLNYIPSNFLKGLKNLQVFYAGNLNIENLHVDTFSYTLNLTFLDLASNNLANRNALTSRLFQPISGLNKITLGRTHLKSLDFLVDANLSSLTILRASTNDLEFINQTVIQSLPQLKVLDLQNNSFTCDCSNAWFIDWAVKNNKTQVLYLNMYECRYPLSLSGKSLAAFNTESCNVNYDFICFVYSSSIVILTLVISFIYHFLKWQLVYAYYLFLAFLNDKKRKRTSNHLDFQYDAFISYSAQEEPWVLEELVPKLEGQHGLRLCLHHRDFQPGKAIIDNIVDAIYNSRKTVCLITRKNWCRWSQRLLCFKHASRNSRACEMTTLSINHKTFICGSRFYSVLKRLADCVFVLTSGITNGFFLPIIISVYQKWSCVNTLYSSDLLTFEDRCDAHAAGSSAPARFFWQPRGSPLELQHIINHFPLQSLPGRPAQTH